MIPIHMRVLSTTAALISIHTTLHKVHHMTNQVNCAFGSWHKQKTLLGPLPHFQTDLPATATSKTRDFFSRMDDDDEVVILRNTRA